MRLCDHCCCYWRKMRMPCVLSYLTPVDIRTVRRVYVSVYKSSSNAHADARASDLRGWSCDHTFRSLSEGWRHEDGAHKPSHH
ncbi:hypothetical protein LIA77_09712 [Sarocladium implicatum]|nr:hypothetical protein LIA77_09712 [Sarocladium implicatum]